MLGRNLPGLSIVLMATLLLGIVLWPYMVITVPSGQVGVLWRRFHLGFRTHTADALWTAALRCLIRANWER